MTVERRNTMKKILLFGFQPFTDERILYHLKEALEDADTKILQIKKEDYLRPLGEVAEMLPKHLIPGQTVQKYTGEEMPVKIILFAGFSREELEAALQLCKACGIGREDLKAVLTPYNLTWDAVTLCEELRKEHQQMK